MHAVATRSLFLSETCSFWASAPFLQPQGPRQSLNHTPSRLDPKTCYSLPSTLNSVQSTTFETSILANWLLCLVHCSVRGSMSPSRGTPDISLPNTRNAIHKLPHASQRCQSPLPWSTIEVTSHESYFCNKYLIQSTHLIQEFQV
jgi:hypothetical protein